MSQLNAKKDKGSTTTGKPVKPKESPPVKEESVKIPVLTEARVREITQEEIGRVISNRERAKRQVNTLEIPPDL